MLPVPTLLPSFLTWVKLLFDQTSSVKNQSGVFIRSSR